MTPEQETRLNQLIQIIRESAEQIIDRGMTERDLLTFLYQKGFDFIGNQSVQNIIDIGSVGLAFSIVRDMKK